MPYFTMPEMVQKRLQECHARYEVAADRILAGVMDDAELDPAMRDYMEQRRHLHTPHWIAPQAHAAQVGAPVSNLSLNNYSCHAHPNAC
jgi:hypothetical protein